MGIRHTIDEMLVRERFPDYIVEQCLNEVFTGE